MYSRGNIDQASRSVKYDLKRKMNYFSIAINSNATSMDLFNAVQKYIHMIELYHLNLKINLAEFCDSEDSENEGHKQYHIKDLLDAKFNDKK